jgi:hypothetical protein
MELLYFILAAYGLTQILVYGSIFNGWRPTEGKLGELFKCPMCMGFWVGALLMFLSPFTELFNFDITVANFFLLGWLSSGTSYIFNMVFGDHGIQIAKKVEETNE